MGKSVRGQSNDPWLSAIQDEIPATAATTTATPSASKKAPAADPWLSAVSDDLKKKAVTTDLSNGATDTSSPSESASATPSSSNDAQTNTEPTTTTSTLPIQNPYNIATLNGVIQPEGTFVAQNHEAVYGLLDKLNNSPLRGDMASLPNTNAPANTAKSDEVVAKRNEAIDNTVLENIKRRRGVYDKTLPAPTKDEISNEKEAVTQAYNNNDIIPVKEGDKIVMKRTTGFATTALKGINEAYKTDQENNYFASLSQDEKIKYLNLKQQFPQSFETTDNSTTPGSKVDLSFGLSHDGLNVDLGSLGTAINTAGGFVGENSAMIGKGATTALAATTVAPVVAGTTALVGTAGAGEFGSFLGLANQFGKGGYTNSYQKTYYALKKQGKTDQEAADGAEKAGLGGEATQLAVGAVLSSNFGNAVMPEGIQTEFNVTGAPLDAIVNGLSKSVGHLVKSEIPKMALSSGAAALVESGTQKAVGVDVKIGDALKDALGATGSGAATALTFFGLHQAVKGITSIPSYMRPLFENGAATMPVEARETYLNKAVEQGVMTEPEKVKISKTVNEFGETKPAVADLPIPEAKKAAITGKLVQAKKIQEEIESLTPYGASFNDRISQLNAAKENIHADINKMYAADDVFDVEHDSLTGEKPVTSSVPKEATTTPDETLKPDTTNGENTTGNTAPDNTSEAPITTQESKTLPSNESPTPQETATEVPTTENKPTVDESQVQSTEKPIVKADEGANVNNEPVAPEKIVNPEATTSEDKQGAKQEIEKRRQEELSKVRTLKSYFEVGNKLKIDGQEYTVVKNGENKFNIETGTGNNRETFVVGQSYNDLDRLKYVANQNGYKPNAEAEINAKYDAELAALDKKQTQNTNNDASNTSEVPKQEVPKSSSEPEHAQSSQEQNTEATKTTDSNSTLGGEGQQPKKKVARTKASGNLRNLSSKIREEGLLPHWAKADLPEGTKSQGFGGKSLDEAVARSLELVADAIDAGKGLADSVNEGFAHVRDYYEKNTKSFDEKKLKAAYKENVKNLLRSGGEVSGITHAETDATRKEFGLGEPYDKTTKSDEQLRADAVDEIKKGYNVDKLLSDVEKGKVPSDKETTILKIHKANLEAAIEKNPSDENLAQLRRLVKASDAAGSEQGRALRSRQGLEIRDDSLAGYFVREQDIHGDEPIPEAKKKQVIKEHTEITEAQRAYDEKIASLEKENARLKAEKKVKEQAAKVIDRTRKTKEDFVNERKDIIQNIRDKWKNAAKDNMLTAVPVPYAKQLAAIAPDVAKLVRSLVEEGVTKLADVTKNIHNTLKDDFPEITEKDVHDIIAGEYNEKKPTQSEINKKISDIKAEARKQIDSAKGDATKIGAIKSRTRTEIRKLEEQLASGDFSKPEKQVVKLDQEAIDLKDNLIKLRKERESRIIHEEYKKRSNWEKFKSGFSEIIGVPRTIMSSLDYSAPLRQALIATVAHPKIAASAAVEMFRQGFSQKRFDRWFYDVKESPRYKLMEQSGLYVADPHDPRMTAREESFMSNLGEKVPLIGETLKFKVGDKNIKIPGAGLVRGSERAYVSYLNKMRVDVFNRMVDDFEAQGSSFEKDPKLFEDLATFVNNATGRGNLGFAESAGPLLSATLFSPRLIASRLSLLRDVATFGNFGKMHPEVRKVMYKDMFAFIGTGLSVLALVKGSSWAMDCKDANGEPCVSVETDPRSTDFGKIKSGNMRWDIWGGFQQYIRVLTQVGLGESKSSSSGKIQELDGKGIFAKTRGDVALSFVRGKLAPVPSMVADVMSGRTATGDKVTLKDEAVGHLMPLIASDLTDAIQDKGVKAIFTMGIPSTFGVGVSTYLPRGYQGKDVKSDPVYSFLYKKSMAIAPPPLDNVPEKDQPKFITKRDEIFKSEWEKVIKYGAFIDQNGYTTTDPKRAVKIVDTNKLDKEDFSNLMRSISTKSTRRAEKELGIKVGKAPKTRS